MQNSASPAPLFHFEAFPTLRTERLILREIVSRDIEAIFRIRGDYEVTRHNIGAAYTRLEDARRLIRQMRKAYLETTELRWGITLAGAKSDVIGMCGFNYWNRVDRRAAIGYDMAQAYWGRGIMREAIGAILRFGFERMDLNRVEANVGAGNLPSIRLLEAHGFIHEGTEREQYFEEDAFHDLRRYGLLRREWAADE